MNRIKFLDAEIGICTEQSKKIARIAFYIGLLIELLIVLVDKSEYLNPIESLLFRVTFLCSCMAIVGSRYKVKEIIICIIFAIIGIVSYEVTGRNEIIRIVAFVMSFRAIEGYEYINPYKLTFYITLVGTVIIALLSITGIYGSISSTSEFRPGIVETRYTFGMGHPNAFHCMLFMIITLGLYIYHKSCKWYVYIVLLVINYVIYIVTDSKSGYGMTTLAIVTIALLGSNNIIIKRFRESKIFYIMSIMAIIVAILGSVAFVCRYDIYNPIILWIDDKVNGRIASIRDSDWAEGMIYTWKIFSEEDNNYYFDLGLIRIFYWYGVVPAIAYMLAKLRLIWTGYKLRDHMLALMIVIYTLYTVFEAHLVSIYIGRNYILLYMGMYWFGRSVVGQDE